MKLLILAVILAQSSTSMVGSGAGGYDWLVGNWTCTNSMPSTIGGPATQTLVAQKTETGSIAFHVTGTNFDQSGYLSYGAPKSTWYAAFSYGNGSYGGESTMQSGNKTIWTGSFFDAASGKKMKIRDTYTMDGMSKYNDLSEYKAGQKWKSVYSGTCTKS